MSDDRIEAAARVAYAAHMEGAPHPTDWRCLPPHVREQFRRGARALLSCALAAPADEVRGGEAEPATDRIVPAGCVCCGVSVADKPHTVYALCQRCEMKDPKGGDRRGRGGGVMNDAERAAFEAWAVDNGCSVDRAANGTYYDRDTRAAWAAWQACATLDPQPQPQDVDEILDNVDVQRRRAQPGRLGTLHRSGTGEPQPQPHPRRRGEGSGC